MVVLGGICEHSTIIFNMNDNNAAKQKYLMLQTDSFCRLCFSSTDDQSLIISSTSNSALFKRIFDCTGVLIKDVSETDPKICDVCISQLVICEKFIKQCREADRKLKHFVSERSDKVESTISVEASVKYLDVVHVPALEVQRTHQTLPEHNSLVLGETDTPGEECLVVEIVDGNHEEFEIDVPVENVPLQDDPTSTGESIGKDHSTGRKRKSGKGKRGVAKTQCQICGTMQQNLKQHMLVHTGEKKHVCPVCHKAFSQKGNLTYHMNQHSGKRLFTCDQCDKTYTDPQSLRSHKITHTNERKFRCEICDETFKYRSSLVMHVRCHTQDKRFPCSECGSSFITSSGLKKHTRTHTGERPYPCAECGKSFKSSNNLSLHKLSHTKERRFQCDVCESWFSYKNVLKTHMNIHLRTSSLHHDDKKEIKRHGELE